MTRYLLFFIIVLNQNIVFGDIEWQWDARRYSSNAQLQSIWAEDFFFNNYKLIGNETILDIGSGDGKITAHIAALVPEGYVIGIDSSQSMIEKSQEEFHDIKNLNFILADAQYESFYKLHKNKFDIITSFTTLHWVPNQAVVLKGIHTALKKGGRCYLSLSSKGNDPIQEIADRLIRHKSWQPLFTHFRDPMNRFNVAEYTALVEAFGLKIISIEDREKRDVLANKEQLVKQIKSWLPHYCFLLRMSKVAAEKFLSEVLDIYLSQFPIAKDGSITLYDHYLEVVAEKP